MNRLSRLLRLPTAALPPTTAGAGAVRTIKAWGQREFFQRLDHQHLANELAQLSKPGHEPAADGSERTQLFDPSVALRPSRRVAPAAEVPDGLAEADFDDSESSINFKPGKKRKPWLEYESMRGATYPAGGSSSSRAPKPPRDLTHDEAQRLQEMYMRKKMIERKIMWLKSQDLPNPEKEAKMSLRRRKDEEEMAKQIEKGPEGTMYPPPFLDTPQVVDKISRLEDKARAEELESRFRTRIRQQKLENARIVKTPAPIIGGRVTDPIERHVERRLLRQREKMAAGLHDILTRQSSQMLYEHLGGVVSIGIVKIKAHSPRATQNIHYTVSSDHDPEWVQRKLNIAAPRIRSDLALKVNMGQTPALRFVPHGFSEEKRRKHLWKFAREIQASTPPGGGYGSDLGNGSLGELRDSLKRHKAD